MHSSDSFLCQYSSSSVDDLLRDETVIAVISSGDRTSADTDPRHLHCVLPVLGQTSVHEVWYAPERVTAGRDGDLQWSSGEELLFAAIEVDERDYPSLKTAIHHAYVQLFDLSERRGYPSIVRVWNYMPRINQGSGDTERYRQFCLGRQQAFNERRYQASAYPSACAVGHDGHTTIIYLLAARAPIKHIENPRQESAYHYPRQYGPASPSFARATQVDWRRGRQIFISGTASIVGHESRSPHDLAGQLQVTLENLEVLLGESARVCQSGNAPAMDLLKVYIRHPLHFAPVQRAICDRFPGVPALYLQGDICRRELLVEIDGVATLGHCATCSLPY
ncbi:MAG: hypothetical protein U5K56_21410 [Halioglobus sp.]|nr:hypothetical protein [Halioglobus sp.]